MAFRGGQFDISGGEKQRTESVLYRSPENRKQIKRFTTVRNKWHNIAACPYSAERACSVVAPLPFP